MHFLRTAYGLPFGLLGILAILAASTPAALAATAPTPTGPSSGAQKVEGSSLEFTWTGALQGDASSIDRSFFRVEIAPAASVPSGSQSTWTTLSNYDMTAPGESTNSLTMGVPEPGSYVWRVCAWGVVDDSVDTSLQQLPNGCSSSQALTATAAATSGSAGSISVPGATRTEKAPDKVTTQERVLPDKIVPPPNRVVTLPRNEDQITKVETERIAAKFGTKGMGSAINLDEDASYGIGGESGNVASGAFGVLTRGLSATLPFVPIPYWSLVLLLAAMPLTQIWRKTTLNMFEWPEDDFLSLSEDLPVDGLKAVPDGADEPDERVTAASGRLSA